MKILVIQTASIGDVVLMTPILEKLHRFYPEAKLDVCLKKGIEGLFVAHPFVRKVWVWDKSHHKYKHLMQLANAIRDEHYDVVANCQRFASSGFLTAYSGAKQTVGFSKNPLSCFFSKRVKHSLSTRRYTMHEVERNLALISHLTDHSAEEMKLYPSQEDDAKMLPYKTQKYICIAPASLWFTKRLPKERWIELLAQLDADLQVYFLGSPSDIDLCEEIIAKSNHPKSVNLAGQLSFLQSVSLMREAHYNLVNDSAPLHFASAINAKVIAFFCSTALNLGFGPRSTNAVVAEISEKLPCRPCGLHGHRHCPKKHFKCAMNIDLKPIIKLLNNK